MVHSTKTERVELNLNNHLLVFYDAADGELMLKNMMKNLKWRYLLPRVPLKNYTYAVIADDFGDFLLGLVHLEKEV